MVNWSLLFQYANAEIGDSASVAEELDKAVMEQYPNTDPYIDTAKRILEAARVDIIGGARDLSVVVNTAALTWAVNYLFQSI